MGAFHEFLSLESMTEFIFNFDDLPHKNNRKQDNKDKFDKNFEAIFGKKKKNGDKRKKPNSK